MDSFERLQPRHLATDDDLRQAGDVARAIARAALGDDPGPMTAAESLSHYVYVGRDVVIKIISAAGHSRLDREIALSASLPTGLTARLLASGSASDIRYACYTRVPGTTPGMGLPQVDAATARNLAEDAVRRLATLHTWTPTGQAEQTLAEDLDHGGFVSRAALLAEIDKLTAADRDGIVPSKLMNGLTAIAQRAPVHAGHSVPVHADCHWGNWLASGQHVTALLDFEWARFGEPADDWFFLASFSGPHLEIVLDVIARATTTDPETLRAQCEVRGATFIASDLRLALEDPATPAWITAKLLGKLDELIAERKWWRRT